MVHTRPRALCLGLISSKEYLPSKPITNFKMAQAPAPRKSKPYLNKEKDVQLICILGDSWTAEHRFKNSIVDELPREYIDIRPHGTITSVPSGRINEKIISSEGAFVVFLSDGGMTINKYLVDEEKQALWVREVPDLSVLYVGACDVANTNEYTVKNVKTNSLQIWRDVWMSGQKEQRVG